MLILDEPTRGIDVGSKTEVYQLMGELAQQGVAMLLISSELPELLALSDRVLVLHDGHFVADLNARETDAQDVLHRSMTGRAQT